MVAIQVPQAEPEIWHDPSGGQGDEPRREVPTRRQSRPRTLPDRATRIRRRRLALLLASVMVVLGGVAIVRLFAGGTFGSAPADTSPTPIDEQVYVVQPGDSLWSIAERVADGGDPRPVVASLREQQGEAELDVGDRLVVDP